MLFSHSIRLPGMSVWQDFVDLPARGIHMDRLKAVKRACRGGAMFGALPNVRSDQRGFAATVRHPGTECRWSVAPLSEIRFPLFLKAAIAAIMGLSVTSCAVVYEGKYAHNEGWRLARVAEIGLGPDIAMPSTRDCRNGLPPEIVQRGRFAVVQFEAAGGYHYRIAPLPPQSALQPGDAVYANIEDCAKPLIGR